METIASGEASHSEGVAAYAYGDYSHAEGYNTVAHGESQHVQGKLNIEDDEGTYAHIVGNGSLTTGGRSNAHTLDWDGNAWFAGDAYVGSTSGTNRDEGSKKLATEEYVDNATNITIDESPTSGSENAVSSDGVYTALTDKASITEANTYDGEQIFQNSKYCPVAQDTANGIGAAYKASRGLVNQQIVGQIIAPYNSATDNYGCNNTAGEIKFQVISKKDGSTPTYTTIALLTENYLDIPALFIAGQPMGTEEWTFELEDGTTVKKNVMVQL